MDEAPAGEGLCGNGRLGRVGCTRNHGEGVRCRGIKKVDQVGDAVELVACAPLVIRAVEADPPDEVVGDLRVRFLVHHSLLADNSLDRPLPPAGPATRVLSEHPSRRCSWLVRESDQPRDMDHIVYAARAKVSKDVSIPWQPRLDGVRAPRRQVHLGVYPVDDGAFDEQHPSARAERLCDVAPQVVALFGVKSPRPERCRDSVVDDPPRVQLVLNPILDALGALLRPARHHVVRQHCVSYVIDVKGGIPSGLVDSRVIRKLEKREPRRPVSAKLGGLLRQQHLLERPVPPFNDRHNLVMVGGPVDDANLELAVELSDRGGDEVRAPVRPDLARPSVMPDELVTQHIGDVLRRTTAYVGLRDDAFGEVAREVNGVAVAAGSNAADLKDITGPDVAWLISRAVHLILSRPTGAPLDPRAGFAQPDVFRTGVAHLVSCSPYESSTDELADLLQPEVPVLVVIQSHDSRVEFWREDNAIRVAALYRTHDEDAILANVHALCDLYQLRSNAFICILPRH